MKIGIIGSGITGITTAYYLSKSGHDVDIFEQDRYPAMRNSYANGGQISVSNSEVWTRWRTIVRAIKSLRHEDAPMLLRPNLNYDKAIWLAKFLVNTVKNEYERNSVLNIQMGIESRKLYDQIVKEENIKYDQNKCGILHFYKNDKYWQNAVKVRELYQNNGCEWDLLTYEEALDKDNSLKYIKDVIGCAWTPSDWTGDINKFCNQLIGILLSKYKVKVVKDVHIKCIDELLFYYDKVVICAGTGSDQLAKTIGDKLFIYPVKGYSVTFNINEESEQYTPNISLLDDESRIVTARLGRNRFRVAGTVEVDCENYDIKRERIDPLLNWVNNNFPKIKADNYNCWTCLRPMTHNMVPIIKQSDRNSRVFYNTGHGHLGWTQSACSARRITDIINKTL